MTIKKGTAVVCIDDTCGLISGHIYEVSFVTEDKVKIKGQKYKYDIGCFRLLEV